MSKPIVSELVLASTSGIRRQLLASAGLEFTVVAPKVDEAALRIELAAAGVLDPADVALALAEAKAREVSRRSPGALVIGADQVLALGDQTLSKARSLDEAHAKLVALRGRWHTLISAISLAKTGETVWRHTEYAELHMRDFSDEWLEHYLRVAGDALTQSVGAYRLEEIGVQLFDETRGDYFAVLGLPIIALLNRLRTVGMLTS
ncbi:MAG: Maf family protein [Hyphomicrobiaceae bacterium]